MSGRGPKTPARAAPPALPERRRKTKPAATAPEIEVRYSVAGRETLATIAAELLPGIDPEEAAPAHNSLGDHDPDATGSGRAGDDASDQDGDSGELLSTSIRNRLNTLNYGDRISNAPGARRPPRTNTSLPEIQVEQRPVGRDTFAAIEHELTPDAESGKFAKEPAPRARQQTVPIEDDEPFDVYEMATFVVRGAPAQLASQTARRKFVEERMLHRLPVSSIDEVDRVDVTPWTVRGTLVVRVWCRVPERKTPESNAPELRNPEPRSPEPRSPEPRSPEPRSPEPRSPEPRSPERKG